MASLAHVTRDDVIAALSLFDEDHRAGRIGGSRVWRGYRVATRYTIAANGGKRYPAKAVLGVAAKLASHELFGGVAQTVPCLHRLGFTVLRDGKPCSTVRVEQLAERTSFEDVAAIDYQLGADVSAIFASGSNRVGEIRGFAAVGHDVGVAAPELTEEAIGELCKLAGSEITVFCDSGAFSEIAFGPDGPRVVKPMSRDAWRRVFATYRRLAEALGDQLFVVAPDRVGDQLVSFERLRRYKADVRELVELGARVLLPVQKGELSQADFYREAVRICGVGDSLVPAMPCKKAATTPTELRDFVLDVRPSHVHLLGLGPRNRSADEYLRAARWFNLDEQPARRQPVRSISLDSAWITANVGRTNGRGGGARRYTKARDLAWSLLGKAASAARVAELALLVALGFSKGGAA